MKLHNISLVAAFGLTVLPGLASAQAADAPLSEAKTRLACGADTILSAVALPDGSIKVTCQKSNTENSTSNNNPLDGASLSTGASVGIASAVVVLGVALGGDDNVTATTGTSP